MNHTPVPIRRRPVSAGRGFIRVVLNTNAALMILPGAILFVLALIGAFTIILETVQSDPDEGVVEGVVATGLSAFVMLGISLVMMMFGSFIYLGLYIEDHLYELRRRPTG